MNRKAEFSACKDFLNVIARVYSFRFTAAQDSNGIAYRLLNIHRRVRLKDGQKLA